MDLRKLSPIVLALSLLPSLAQADDVPLAERVRRRIESELVKPLAEHAESRSRFSRARPPPRERRIRVLDIAPSADARGRGFMRFSVDVRFGSEWREDDIVGCAYPTSGELFVKVGEAYRPASFLLGKEAEPVTGVCTRAR